MGLHLTSQPSMMASCSQESHALCIAGAVVADTDYGDVWFVPAVPDLCIVDVTGCGNAFCGGFLAAWQAGESVLDAALWGTAAASFTAECPAVPVCAPSEVFERAKQRVEALRYAVFCVDEGH